MTQFAISLGVFRVNRSCKPANPAFTMSTELRNRKSEVRTTSVSDLNSLPLSRMVHFVVCVFGLTSDFRFLVRAAGDGGADRDRTDDLKLAKLPLSQLSYGPSARFARAEVRNQKTEIRKGASDFRFLSSDFCCAWAQRGGPGTS